MNAPIDNLDAMAGFSARIGSARWLPAIEHRRKNGAWWEGKRIRLLCEIQTRCGDKYSRRMIFTVRRKWGGLDVSRPHGRIKNLSYRHCEVEVPNDRDEPLAVASKKPIE